MCNNHPISSAFQRPMGARRGGTHTYILCRGFTEAPRKLAPLAWQVREEEAKHCSRR